MKKLLLITFVLSAFVFAKVGVDPYDPDTFKPSHPVGVDMQDHNR